MQKKEKINGFREDLILLSTLDKIEYFKSGDLVLVNNYDNNGEDRRLLDLNTSYLSYNAYSKNIDLFKMTEKDGSIFVNKRNMNVSQNINEVILNRKKVEELLNPYNYDAFYVINVDSGVKQAYTKNDGYVFGNGVVPEDNDIVTLDYAYRLMNSNISFSQIETYPQELEKIKSFRIYGEYPTRKSDGFKDILITTKDNNLIITYFTLDFLGIDKFCLRTKKVLTLKNGEEISYEEEMPVVIEKKQTKETLIGKLSRCLKIRR